MFVVYGTRLRRRRLGQVAEFCPMCRDLRVCTMHVVRRVDHLYYIPLGRGKVAGHEVTCDACGWGGLVALSRYTKVAEGGGHDIDDLMPHSLAALDRYEKYVARRQRIADQRLGPRDRIAAIADVLTAVNGARYLKSARHSFARGPRTWLGLMAVFATVAVWIALGVFSWPLRPLTHVLMGVILLGSVIFMFHADATAEWRAIRRRFGSYLREELGPMHPSVEELRHALAALSKHKITIARTIKARKLHRLLAEGGEATGGTDNAALGVVSEKQLEH